jgi:phospholipase C
MPLGTPLLRSDPSAAKGGRVERLYNAALSKRVFWAKKLWWILLLIAQPALSAELPRPDHIVIVIEENKSFDQIIDNREAPYINELSNRGALFTQSHGVTHPSQPNYLALFSGSTHGVSSNICPLTLSGDNLASQLQAKGLSFTSYAESMPEAGYDGCYYEAYMRKHNPAAIWKELVTVNKPFSAFPTNYTQLPTVAFVVPDQLNDMHDGSIAQGDAWLKKNIEPYARWAKQHNSLLIVTWDEDDGSSDNRIATIFVGAMLKPGRYEQRIDHYNLLHTLEEMYGLAFLNESAKVKAIESVWVKNISAGK